MTRMHRFFVAVLFFGAVVATTATGCAGGGLRVALSGPYMNGQDVVVLTNNLKYDLDVLRDGNIIGTVSTGETGRVGFGFFGGRDVILTVKAYTLNEAGKKVYIGVAERSFYRSDRIQSWIVNYVERPRSG
jgi:hypothetical protein